MCQEGQHSPYHPTLRIEARPHWLPCWLQALVAVIAIEDDWLVDRVKCALMDPQPPGRELGILHQVSDAPTVSGRELTKRFALIKLALFLVHRVPEVCAASLEPLYRLSFYRSASYSQLWGGGAILVSIHFSFLLTSYQFHFWRLCIH